jgi:WD40 repeat protein
MPLERIDLFYGDEHPNKGLLKMPPEEFSFGGKAVQAARISGRFQPGRKISNPGGVPGSGHGVAVAWSPTGRNFFAGFTNSPYFKAWYFDGDNFDALTTSGWTTQVNSIDWSPNGHFLSVCTGDSPYVRIFAFTEPGYFSTALTNANPPGGQGFNASWSPDGQTLAVSHDGGSFLSVYKIGFNYTDLGLSTVTKIAAPDVAIPSLASACSWSPDGQYLAVGHLTAPYLTVYKYNGNTLVKIPGPPALAPVAEVEGLGWSPDGRILTICTSPQAPTYGAGIRFYHFENGAFQDTFISINATFNPSRAIDCEWSPDGRFLAVGHADSPYLSVYTFDGENFSQMKTPSDPPSGSVLGVSWSPDSSYLAAAHLTGRLAIYKALPGRVNGGNIVELVPLSNIR